MANFNTYMFIADASQKVSEYRTSIEGSDSYEEGKNEAIKNAVGQRLYKEFNA